MSERKKKCILNQFTHSARTIFSNVPGLCKPAISRQKKNQKKNSLLYLFFWRNKRFGATPQENFGFFVKSCCFILILFYILVEGKQV